ncbi:ABC transporter permease [Roseomonas hellenica]|uniref:ABC transporter permease n=1 Tax=Plastoroseomonas hellenica TaxID=2687306 RepID=A0ABS5F208_9PROT|nr:ABC transporter permease [Plastoroseomonas hellenica]MBR0666633.1 ABC transporter permease [Plastoroseomonas hellenica]
MLDQPIPSPPGTASPHRVFDAQQPERLSRAFADIREGVERWRLAWALARSDIRNRYRGSVLGPLWLTLSTAIMLLAMGFLYSRLFKLELANYLPWLAVSLILWNMISQVVGEACTCLTSAEGVVQRFPLPYSLYAIRSVMRNMLIAAHNLPLIAIVLLIFGVAPGWGLLLLPFGLLLFTINALSVSLLLGMICARFRDVGPIMGSIVQIAFFVTPIIWKPELIGEHSALLLLNPFHAVLESLRAPIIEHGGNAYAWLSACIYTLILAGISGAFFVRFRDRLAFWV